MSREYDVSAVGLFQGTDFSYYLADYHVEASRDGSQWMTVIRGEVKTPPFETAFADAGNPYVLIRWKPVKARFIRIMACADGRRPWTVHELKLYSSLPADGLEETLLDMR